MKNDEMPLLTEVPRIGGQYIRLKTGELGKWQSFDEATQTFEIESLNRQTTRVHRRETEIPTSNDELDYLLSMANVNRL